MSNFSLSLSSGRYVPVGGYQARHCDRQVVGLSVSSLFAEGEQLSKGRGAFRLLISRSHFSNHVYNMFRIGTSEVFKSEGICGEEVTTELDP